MIEKTTRPDEAVALRETFVRFAQLQEVGVPKYDRKTLVRMVQRGLFPAPLQLSDRKIAWRLSELLHWKSTRPEARSAQAAKAKAARAKQPTQEA